MRRDRNQLRNVILAGVCTPSINGVTGVLSEAGFIAAFAVKSIRISFADDDEILLAMDYGQEKIEGHWVVSLDRIASRLDHRSNAAQPGRYFQNRGSNVAGSIC